MVRFTIMGAAAFAVLAPSISSADIIAFDPDGGGPNGTLQVGSFDESPGNVLAVGAIDPATGAIRVNTPFQVLYQARIGTLLSATNRVLAAPGTGNLGELTVVASFNEIATSGSATSATLSTNTSQVGSFVRIFYDVANDSNDLAGTGFTNGTLIYEGRVDQGGTGSFAANPTAIGALDQFDGNNYPGLSSVTGAGGTNITATTVTANSAFFVGGVPILSLSFNTFTNVPFIQVDPAAMMFNGTLAANAASIGTVNGRSGPNFLFQADAVSSFVVPEPASVAMTVLGLGGAGLGSVVARRRRVNASV